LNGTPGKCAANAAHRQVGEQKHRPPKARLSVHHVEMASAEIERLRRLLDDAGGVAKQIGDEARAEPPGAGYFAGARSSGIERVIERVARHDGNVTMFVGAGVSMEAELPSWNTLVRRLLLGAPVRERAVASDRSAKRAASASTPRPAAHAKTELAAREQWVEQVMREGPLAAASVAASLYASAGAFRRALREAVYARDPGSYVPGALARQIAALKVRMGPRLRILTVNYDGLLELALAEHELTPVSYVDGQPEPARRAAVWHLHGRLMRSASGRWEEEGELVLTEGSYVGSTRGRYPKGFVADRLKDSLCLFVGLSMTDPNFIRWLYSSKNGRSGRRFVIFVRQASPIADGRVRRLLEESAAKRWQSYRVTPVWANYYGEVAQIVHEIGLRCNAGRPLDFRVRAARRLEKGAAGLIPPAREQFAAAQGRASKWLRERLDDVRIVCGAVGLDLGGHTLGLGLWAVDHADGRIMNWASADRAYQEPDTQVSSSLHVGSRWVAAAAICNGVAIEQDPNVYASRWRFVRAMPIVADANGERSIVGALTFASTTPLERFPLAQAQAPAGLLGELDSLLTSKAAQFFQ
jgi:hypothetical protein